MPSEIVYVHGIGNKRPRERLKSDWDHALFGGSLGARSHMAYWADLRYPTPLAETTAATELEDQLPLALEDLNELRWHNSEPPKEFVEQILVGLPGDPESASPDNREGREGDLAEWGRRLTDVADALAAGEAGLSPSGQEVFPGPRAIRQAIFRALVRTVLADVHAYFFGGQGPQIQERLRTVLQAVETPAVVVAHSLGSVIAYDVLSTWTGPPLAVPLLVTLGSPLGTEEIQDVVAQPLLVPAGVARWVNACDARDLVALDPTLRGEFHPADRVADFLVVNGSDNHHGIREYLLSAVVQQAVHSVLQQ